MAISALFYWYERWCCTHRMAGDRKGLIFSAADIFVRRRTATFFNLRSAASCRCVSRPRVGFLDLQPARRLRVWACGGSDSLGSLLHRAAWRSSPHAWVRVLRAGAREPLFISPFGHTNASVNDAAVTIRTHVAQLSAQVVCTVVHSTQERLLRLLINTFVGQSRRVEWTWQHFVSWTLPRRNSRGPFSNLQ